jgi:hypothetical protein
VRPLYGWCGVRCAVCGDLGSSDMG